jgi:hypothetical protein
VENIAGSSISPKLYSANKGGLPFAMAQREGMPLFKGQGRCKLANAGEYPTQKKKLTENSTVLIFTDWI